MLLNSSRLINRINKLGESIPQQTMISTFTKQSKPFFTIQEAKDFKAELDTESNLRIIARQTQTGGFCYIVVTDVFLKKILMKKNIPNLNIYEIIECEDSVECISPTKLFFDVEYPVYIGEQIVYDFIDYMKNVLQKTLGVSTKNVIITYNSGGKTKKNGTEYSFHLIFNTDRVFQNIKHLHEFIFKDLIDNLPENFKFLNPKPKEGKEPQMIPVFDTVVYTKNRNLRMIGQSKYDKSCEILICDTKTIYTYNDLLVISFEHNDTILINTNPVPNGQLNDILTSDDVFVDKQKELEKISKKIDEIITIEKIEDYMTYLKNVNSFDYYTIVNVLIKYERKDLFELLLHPLKDNKDYGKCIEKNIDGTYVSYLEKIYGKKAKFVKKYDINVIDLTSNYKCPFSNSHNGNNRRELVITKNCCYIKCNSGLSGDISSCCGKRHIISFSKNDINVDLTIFLHAILKKYYIQVIDTTHITSFYDIKITPDFVSDDRYVGDLSKYIEPIKYDDETTDDFLSFIPNSDFLEKQKKFCLINSDLGTGKTFSLIEYIKKYPEENKRILMITNRVAYGSSILQRYTSEGIDFKFYKNETEIHEHDKVIIQLESIRKVNIGILEDFDLVILDECESIFSQFSSSTFTNQKYMVDNINTFELIMIQAKQIILMDAFLTKRSFDVIKNFGSTKTNTVFIDNTLRRGGIDAIELNIIDGDEATSLEEQVAEHMTQQFSNGKKFYFFNTSVKTQKHIIAYFKEKCKKIDLFPRIKEYFGGMDDNEKKIGNASIEWLEYDVIFTTSVITVGINQDNPHFHCAYLIQTDNSCTVRDSFQSLYRNRHYIDNKIFYYIDAKTKQYIITPKMIKKQIDIQFKHIDIYKQKILSVEEYDAEKLEYKKLNGKEWFFKIIYANKYEEMINHNMTYDTFEYFCNKQNYNLIKDETTKKIRSITESSETYIYNDIEVLTGDEFEDLEKRQNKTEIEKVTVDKSFFSIHSKGHGDKNEEIFKKWKNNRVNFYKDVLLNDIYDEKYLNDNKIITINKIKTKNSKIYIDLVKGREMLKECGIKDAFKENVIDIKKIENVLKNNNISFKQFKNYFKGTYLKMKQTDRTRIKGVKTYTNVTFSYKTQSNLFKDGVYNDSFFKSKNDNLLTECAI